MKTPQFMIGWVDLALLAVIITGVFRGRKRGMSEELLDIIKWGAVLAGAALVLRPIGQFFSSSSMFSLLACYVFTYALIIVAISVLVALVRKQVGDKLVSSDFFGSAEYYMGMGAGAFRYLCVTIVVLGFLNARYYSPEEQAADAAFQQSNFGDIRFPTLATLQDQVFNKSMTGMMLRDHASFLLIDPTAPETKELAGANNVVRARERSVNQVLERR